MQSQSRDSGISGGGINNFANGDGEDNGGHGSFGDPNGGDNNIVQNKFGSKDDGDDRKRREFLPVKASNTTITVFTGFNLNNNFYIPFNKAISKSIFTQGGDGEALLNILDHVETYGDDKFMSIHLRALTDGCPRVYEYVRVVNVALLNLTGGVAQGVVEHGCDNGLDAWRRLCSRCIPGAEDLQHLFMEELILLKPVNVSEVDVLFSEVERLTEWYIKIDSFNL